MSIPGTQFSRSYGGVRIVRKGFSVFLSANDVGRLLTFLASGDEASWRGYFDDREFQRTSMMRRASTESLEEELRRRDAEHDHQAALAGVE